MTLHVCLLYPGGPTPEKSIRTFLEEQLHDPLVKDSFPGFFRSFWIWLLLYFRNRTPLLEGPCSSYQQADEHVQELNRLLGPDFRCHALHHFGKANIDSILKSIPNRSSVVLLPLIPHRCRTLFSTLAQARRELRSKKSEEFWIQKHKKGIAASVCDDCSAHGGGKTDLQRHVTFRICRICKYQLLRIFSNN